MELFAVSLNVRQSLRGTLLNLVKDVERYFYWLHALLSCFITIVQIFCGDCCGNNNEAFIKYLHVNKYIAVCKHCYEMFERDYGQQFGYVPPNIEQSKDVACCTTCNRKFGISLWKKKCNGCGKVWTIAASIVSFITINFNIAGLLF